MAEERSNESDGDEDPFGKLLATNNHSQIDPEKEQDDQIAQLQKELGEVVKQKIADFEKQERELQQAIEMNRHETDATIQTRNEEKTQILAEIANL